MTNFLPVTMQELLETGVSQPDFVYITGDAYVDHPSFGAAIITRLLQSQGYSVAVLAQPDWHTVKDFTRFGKPRLAFLVTGGNIDSMVAHYTSAKRKRSTDMYSPGGRAGLRPDRAVITYCRKIREAYPDAAIAIGGLEASLRRFAHYDYWDDTVRPSILADSGACPRHPGTLREVIKRLAAHQLHGESHPSRGSHATAPIACDGSRQQTASTLGR